VRARIAAEGPLRVADFEHDGTARGTWWDWKPAKRALEYLYNRGELMIANRVNFHRVYDLRERVLPEWVDRSEPTIEETYRHLVERSIRMLGLADPGHAADYAYDLKRVTARRIARELLDEGVVVEVPVTLLDGLRGAPRHPAAAGTGRRWGAHGGAHDLPQPVRQPVLGAGARPSGVGLPADVGGV